MSQAGVRERRAVAVRGIVQGVGFRPFVLALARRYGLTGLVCNDAAGVCIEAEGPPERLDLFLRGLATETPPLAVIEAVTWRPLAALGEQEFRIEESRGARATGAEDGPRALISPDVATCPACLKELFDPADRRYRYPFINCTHCGPRFTITRSVPYDRATTTMAGFLMCPACQREYEDPADRRFHAQPNACAACGPEVRLLDRSGRVVCAAAEDPIRRAVALVRQGAIVAIKGLGGYHLACDPFNDAAVRALRRRKGRPDKPFALMAADLEQARGLCLVQPDEAALLASPARPIVLLRRTEAPVPPAPGAGCPRRGRISPAVAPRQQTLGVMLAYTPLHHLLLREAGIPLVMTSGNRGDEPIAYRDEEALVQLGPIADYFLAHNRPIHMRCDDSIVQGSGIGSLARGGPPPTTLIRRSRGYAPAPLAVATRFSRPLLACGAELKNTFCLAREQHAFLSHHIGDLENYETLCSFREGIEHYCRLFAVQPELVVYDLHPEYLSTQFALERAEAGMTAVGVQHHHAHIASCLADNERPAAERVIGVALDGTGYGVDGALWGGEFLEGSLAAGFARRAHLEYVPLPGGEAAIRQPWRTAVARLITLYGEEAVLRLPLPLVQRAGERRVRQIARLLEHRLQTPLTSSAGRLFDTVAALLGVPGSERVTYEGQAAVELELLAPDLSPLTPHSLPAAYPFRLRTQGDGWILETGGIITGVVADLLAQRPPAAIAGRFHRTLAEMVAAGCARIADFGLADRMDAHPKSAIPHPKFPAVALSGGVFQNRLLLELTTELLRRNGFVVYRHRRVPANDAGLSLGQAVLADAMLKGSECV